MRLNPEFMRNLWVEMSLHRIIVMPMVLGGLFYLSWMTSSVNTLWNPRNFLLLTYAVLVMLWGVRQSGDSVVQEILDRTWDSQRMSILTPWSMTWGKLLGSTSFTWYGGLLVLGMFSLVIHLHYPYFPTERLYQLLIYSVGCGLLGQSLSMLLSLLNIHSGTLPQRRYISGPLAVGLFTTLFYLLGVVFFLASPEGKYNGVVWHHWSFSLPEFILYSLGIFLLWSWLGLYRLMSQELQKPKGPFVWIFFLLFLSWYGAGFIQRSPTMELGDQQMLQLWLAQIIMASMTYFAAFFESKDLLAYRKTLFYARHGAWRNLIHSIPLWWVGVCLVAAILLNTLLTPFRDDFTQATMLYEHGTTIHLKWAMLATLLFMLRDLALMQLLYLNPHAQRAKLTIILYLLVLYILLPRVTEILGVGHLTAPLFYPMAGYDPLLIVSPPLVESVLIMGLAWSRWKSLMKSA
ncbi:hypothetical protein [Magnetococcus sp. PR-3]|uniref:hypothetical protein n=1 Tax=Magnetococcus sp. PR-3 TaxID=3120355 RepID=UPI002FCDEF13